MAKTGVLIIDMQDFFLKLLPESNKNRLISSQRRVLRTAQMLDMPVALIEFQGFGRSHPDIRSHYRTTKRKTQISKESPSAFSATSLCDWLRAQEVSDLHLMGIWADYCVRDTANDAIAMGFRLSSSRDVLEGMGSYWKENTQELFTRNGAYFPHSGEAIKHFFMQNASEQPVPHS